MTKKIRNTALDLKKRYEIDNFLNILAQNNFKKTVDVKGHLSTNADLYCIEINYVDYTKIAQFAAEVYLQEPIYQFSDKKYFLILNHYNKKENIHLQGFDLWIAVYNNEKEIGKKEIIHCHPLRLSCSSANHLMEFFHSIAYLQNKKN